MCWLALVAEMLLLEVGHSKERRVSVDVKAGLLQLLRVVLQRSEVRVSLNTSTCPGVSCKQVLAENSPALLADLWAFRVAKKQDHLRQPPTGDASTTASVLEAKVGVYIRASLGRFHKPSSMIKLAVVAVHKGGKV
jgi:hypothetical protein